MKALEAFCIDISNTVSVEVGNLVNDTQKVNRI
jgi:hypothetical protein